MNRNKSIILLVALSVFCILFFENCSGVIYSNGEFVDNSSDDSPVINPSGGSPVVENLDDSPVINTSNDDFIANTLDGGAPVIELPVSLKGACFLSEKVDRTGYTIGSSKTVDIKVCLDSCSTNASLLKKAFYCFLHSGIPHEKWTLS